MGGSLTFLLGWCGVWAFSGQLGPPPVGGGSSALARCGGLRCGQLRGPALQLLCLRGSGAPWVGAGGAA
eukprot:3260253-Alexandrium_andersonii.AAC.1